MCLNMHPGLPIVRVKKTKNESSGKYSKAAEGERQTHTHTHKRTLIHTLTSGCLYKLGGMLCKLYGARAGA